MIKKAFLGSSHAIFNFKWEILSKCHKL